MPGDTAIPGEAPGSGECGQVIVGGASRPDINAMRKTAYRGKIPLSQNPIHAKANEKKEVF